MNSGPLQKLADTRNGSELLEPMARLRDSEPEPCLMACCCSYGLEKYIPYIANSHHGAIIVGVFDCFFKIADCDLAWNITQIFLEYNTEVPQNI